MKKYCLACLLLLWSFVLGCNRSPLPPTESEGSGAHIETIPHTMIGIYSIVDPDGKETTPATTYRPVKEIIGDYLAEVKITQRRSGQVLSEFAFPSAFEATEKQLFELFQSTERNAHSAPIWNIDWSVEIVGTLKYKNGIEGKFAIAGFKVGFQDQTGQPWYFEWEEKYPSRNAR